MPERARSRKGQLHFHEVPRSARAVCCDNEQRGAGCRNGFGRRTPSRWLRSANRPRPPRDQHIRRNRAGWQTPDDRHDRGFARRIDASRPGRLGSLGARHGSGVCSSSLIRVVKEPGERSRHHDYRARRSHGSPRFRQGPVFLGRVEPRPSATTCASSVNRVFVGWVRLKGSTTTRGPGMVGCAPLGARPLRDLLTLIHVATSDRLRARSGRMDSGLEEQAAVAAVVEAYLRAQVKILEIVAFCVEVADCRTGADQYAVYDTPVARLVAMRFPPGQVLAVEQGLKTNLRRVEFASGCGGSSPVRA